MSKDGQREDVDSTNSTSEDSETEAAPVVVSLDAERSKRWPSLLLRNGGSKTGVPKKLFANAVIPLRFAPEWKDVLHYDEFGLSVLLMKAPPWGEKRGWKPRHWFDQDGLLFAEWLQRAGIEVGVETAEHAAYVAAKEQSFHPVRDYLSRLRWDGKSRIDHWLAKHMGAEESRYHAEVGSRWLISGIARIMQPGCKADSLLQLEGPQGIGKGMALEALATQPKWFTDEIHDVGRHHAAMGLAGKWVVEFAELEALRGKTWEAQKAFISRTVDHYRPPYARTYGDFPRQNIFAATTNRYETLTDSSGNRRFWPVRCTKADAKSIRPEVDQLWAEAKARFDQGEHWWLDQPELVRLAEAAQEERFEADPLECCIAEFIAEKDEVTILQVIRATDELDGEPITRALQHRVAEILRHLGLERVRSMAGSTRNQWVFRRKGE